jgi:hypothetical protein
MNIRYVSYYIDGEKSYKYFGPIITHNMVVKLDSNLKQITELPAYFLQEDLDTTKPIVGIEDLRVFYHHNANNEPTLKYLGTGMHRNGRIGIVHGEYKDTLSQPREIKSAFNDELCEKNWVFIPMIKGNTIPFKYPNSVPVIYNWYPLNICEIGEDSNGLQLYEVGTRKMPKMFKHVRGSSSGFEYMDEIWYVTHMVEYGSPRYYYHVIVVFDKDLNLKRYSAPFKFEAVSCIEFCLSIVVEQERVLMNYSTLDRTTRIAEYDKSYIDSQVVTYHY